MDLISELKNDFTLFKTDYISYKQKVDSISNLFQLSGLSKLRSDYLPTYLVGNYQEKAAKYILFGLNPGFNEKGNQIEESIKNENWDKYQVFINNFFRLFKENKLKSLYYIRLSQLFTGLENKPLTTYEEKYDFYQSNLVAIDLVPYHSTNFGITNDLNMKQLDYLVGRFQICFDFIKHLHYRIVIFHGKPIYNILVRSQLLKDFKKYAITKQTNLFLFHYDDVPCVLFDRMITQAGSGVKYSMMKDDIPKRIKEFFSSKKEI